MKWKPDLFHHMLRIGIYLLLWGISLDMTAQEDVKRTVRDSVRTVSEMQEGNSLSVSSLHEDFVAPDEKSLGSSLPRPSNADSLLHLSLKKPLVLPYYTNPSPMFRGDYSTGGIIKGFENGVFYGSGEQTSLPGIGLMNKASLGYMYQFNPRWSVQVGIDAMKMNMPFAVGQSFGTSGAVMYRASDRVAFKVFGSYYRGQTYGMESHSYGASMTVDMSERFSVEMGVQRYYNPLRGGWETVPVLVPSYKFNKFNLGIDVGGLIYEILHKVVIDKNRMKMGNPTMGPPAHFQMQGR